MEQVILKTQQITTIFMWGKITVMVSEKGKINLVN